MTDWITIWMLVKSGLKFDGKEMAYWEDVGKVDRAQAAAEIAKRPHGTYVASVETPELPDGFKSPGSKATKGSGPVVAHKSGGNW